jgi:drug/metabolite transporter (DMT)-like permease
MTRARALNSGLGSILGAVCIWGAIPFVISAAARELMPGELMVLRMLTAGVLLALAIKPRRLLAALRCNPGAFLTLSLLGFALPNLLYIYALRTAIPIPILTFIANSYPVWAIALAAIFLRERPTVYHLGGMACTLVGLYLMAGVIPGAQLKIPPGIVLVLLASLGWASGTVASKKLTTTVDATSIAAGRHLLSGILMCPVMLIEGTHLAQASLGAWLAMALLVAMSVISYKLYYGGLAHTSVTSASVLETLGSVITWGIAAVFYNQGLGGTQTVGACLILAGTLLVSIHGLRHAQDALPLIPLPIDAKPKSLSDSR